MPRRVAALAGVELEVVPVQKPVVLAELQEPFDGRIGRKQAGRFAIVFFLRL